MEKVKGRIRRWDCKSLSMGGRIMAINSVLSAMPVYGLAMAPIPKKVVLDIR